MKDKPENREETREIKDNHLTCFGFDHQSPSIFIHKKTEKLIAALYMVTDFIKDTEPLKWQLRTKSLNLISVRANFLNASVSRRKELLKEYRAIWIEIISLSEIAQYSGLISKMNHSVLKREFEKLMSILEDEENEHNGQNTLVLHPEFFEKTSEILTSQKKEKDVFYEHQPTISKGHNQKIVIVPSIDVSRISPKTEYLPKITHSVEPKNTKTDRKAIITKLLSKKGGLSIKDFSQAIKDCSEKTIQRELLAMVAIGTIKKQGERRWSTYSLAF